MRDWQAARCVEHRTRAAHRVHDEYRRVLGALLHRLRARALGAHPLRRAMSAAALTTAHRAPFEVDEVLLVLVNYLGEVAADDLAASVR